MTEYEKFIAGKTEGIIPEGIECGKLHKSLFGFQKQVVKRALGVGRFAVWADCGLGKTRMQLSWASQIPGNVLIVAPLAVAQQTVKEGKEICIAVRYCRDQDDVRPGITITNYQMLHRFDPSKFKGVALDESSIVKGVDGKTRAKLFSDFRNTPYKTCYTATPSPNDFMEIGSHAEFLGICTYFEMLSMFFVHDGGETSKWRLKKHAEDEFWKWVCSWAVMFRKPSDLGFDDDGFILPEIEYINHTVESDWQKKGYSGLLPYVAGDLRERIAARKHSVSERVDYCAKLVDKTDPSEPWLFWCNLNSEANALEKAIPRAMQVSGSDSIEEKEKKLWDFTNGTRLRMISKPSICGHGLNWQHCANIAFVGLSDSWEQFYQAVRRCWRFGQKRKVKVHIIVSSAEGAVLRNIMRKEADAERMMANMVRVMQTAQEKEKPKEIYPTDVRFGKKWEYRLGDCVEEVAKLESNSVHYSVFSPPFSSLYVYSSSMRDMGNSHDDEEFFDHFKYLIKELYRVMMPGRMVSFHCMNLPTTKSRDGYIGQRDFRGELIRAFQDEKFIYHSEVCIWKDPVTAMQRTKAIGLLWKQIKKDSCMSRQGIADYLITMRKPGDNAKPVGHRPDDFPVRLWQQWASPVWMDINPSDTLQYRSAREHKDERHICPLQLGVIRRAVMMWSNPKDIVLSPFGGIASEGVVALECGRRFIGVELKSSYWKQGVGNLKNAEQKFGQMLLPVDIE